MVERKSRRDRAAGKGSKNGTDKESAAPELSPQEANRALVLSRIEELTLPILDKYGELAFEEILGRLNQVIEEYTLEVQHLFTGLVDQAREDHGRLRGLLDRDAGESETDESAPAPTEDKNMSEFERRLESDDLASNDAAEGGATN